MGRSHVWAGLKREPASLVAFAASSLEVVWQCESLSCQAVGNDERTGHKATGTVSVRDGVIVCVTGQKSKNLLN